MQSTVRFLLNIYLVVFLSPGNQSSRVLALKLATKVFYCIKFYFNTSTHEEKRHFEMREILKNKFAFGSFESPCRCSVPARRTPVDNLIKALKL